MASFPILIAPDKTPSLTWRWTVRLPFILIGASLGASIWYVAHRMFGNRCGFIALILYAFAPTSIIGASLVQPLAVAAWGSFGMIFTAAAMAHTLYAPREVVLWNWRRIILLGVSIGLALSAIFSTWVVLLLAFVFVLYLAPDRRPAASLIMAVSLAVGLWILLLSYGFHLRTFFDAILANPIEVDPALLVSSLSYRLLGQFFAQIPAVAFLLLASLLTIVFMRRTWFFGVIGPLLVFAILVVLGMLNPHQGGYFLYSLSLPFAFIFIAGVMADLMETGNRSLVTVVLLGVLAGHVVFSLKDLFSL